MGRGNNTIRPIHCATVAQRYESLKNSTNEGQIIYSFALDLQQAVPVLLTLLGSIVQTIRFLGPQQYALSIVKGRSTDGTCQIVAALRHKVEHLGAALFLSTSNVSPKDGNQDCIEVLALLRNIALAPMIAEATKYSSDAQVIFFNNVYICPHDILELVYQQKIQDTTITCGIDWSEGGAIFYNFYVARSIVGETFWQVAQDGGWQFSGNFFWADRETRVKYLAHRPFEVYACWNGGSVISAKPIMDRQIAFRRNNEAEGVCYMGEPTLFAKDLWRLGLGKIQVIPSVNVAYDNRTEAVKDQHGRVEDQLTTISGELQTERVQWKESPPSLVKCMQQFHEPYWVSST